jgi:hypothetical protein
MNISNTGDELLQQIQAIEERQLYTLQSHVTVAEAKQLHLERQKLINQSEHIRLQEHCAGLIKRMVIVYKQYKPRV